MSKQVKQPKGRRPRRAFTPEAKANAVALVKAGKSIAQVGEVVSEKRVARVMQEGHMVARPKKKFVVTTDSSHDGSIAPNLLARSFTAPAPDRVWVTDVTYVATMAGWLYLQPSSTSSRGASWAGPRALTTTASWRSTRSGTRWGTDALDPVSSTTPTAEAPTPATTTSTPSPGWACSPA